ncbi:chloride channel protein [Actinomyces vulturis]|uniref:chloride channel protein n=1 Tax=Actinomyces vulturis TaxID=1857645 RepID=UPI0008374F0F|nr:chloride channel protein [Actinomyces vulturis]
MSGLRDRILGYFRYNRSGLLILAALVGLGSGLGATAFRLGIDAWSEFLTGAPDYSVSMGPSFGALAIMGPWFVVVAPLISAAIYGPLMAKFGGASTGHGVGGVMFSARRKDGSVNLKPAVTTTVASTLTIGGGGSVGPEGPIAELGAAVGSLLGHIFKVPEKPLRTLAAAGTAAGIAAAFDAPLAGAFFAMEVILVDFTAETFGFVVISCVASSVLADHLMDKTLSLSLPTGLVIGEGSDLGVVATLGILGGVIGVLFSRIHFRTKDLIDWAWHGPSWLRPIVGSLLIGGILLIWPEMYGESNGVLDRALHGRYTLVLLVILMLAKIVATSVTLAVGGVGGVFAPSLFIGGMLGAAVGTVASPGNAAAAAMFGVVGMGAVFTGAARAPITGVILIIEMTGQYDLLLPLMLAIALATGVSRFLTRTTIYTEELRKRGEDIDDPVRATLVGRTPARALMQRPPTVLPATMNLADAAQALRSSDCYRLPVIDGDDPDNDRWLGCVSAFSVAEARLEGDDQRTIDSLVLNREHVRSEDSPTTVLRTLLESHAEGLPVIDHNGLLLGWVSQEDMVRRLYRHQRRALEAAEARTSFGARMYAYEQIWLRRLREAATAERDAQARWSVRMNPWHSHGQSGVAQPKRKHSRNTADSAE